MKKFFASAGTVVLAGVLILAAPMTANAHVKSASINCSQASVSLTSYDQGATAEITLDGVVKHTGTFDGTLVQTWPVSGNVEHTFSVVVASQDGDQYNMNYSETTTTCYTPPPPTPVVEFGYSASCGALSIISTSTNVNANWYYGVQALENGTRIGSAVVKGSGTKTTVIPFAEDYNGGSVEIAVETYASTEQDLLPAGWALGTKHLITVVTDCAPPPSPCVGNVDWHNGDYSDVSWEIHLGRQISDRNSPATFQPTDFGGLASIVGFDENMGNTDNVYVHYPEDVGHTNVYTFVDGTIWTVTVSEGQINCAPVLTWVKSEVTPTPTDTPKPPAKELAYTGSNDMTPWLASLAGLLMFGGILLRRKFA